jgi:predicted  nucleic acid-binding Zn-ribbon protein
MARKEDLELMNCTTPVWDDLLKLREQVKKLQAELMEIKTTRTLREAYITGVEKGCESLREGRDRWKSRCNSVMTDISNALSANGIEFTVKDVLGDVNWKLEFDIPELNEAKKKVEDLEKKLKAVESKETFWRDRKEEEEDYHHYWLHTFDRVVKQAADKGIHIDVHGTDEECNAGIVVVDNVKAEDLESQVVQMEDANQKLRKRIKRLEDDNAAKGDALILAKDRGDYWCREHGVKTREYQKLERKHDAKWSAMTEALKDKGVEVIYMGEQDNKPIIDVKVPGWDDDKKWVNTFAKDCADFRADKFRLERERDELKEQCDILRKDGVLKGQEIGDLNAEIDILKKELEDLKSRTLDNVEIRLSCGDIVWTYCDGFVHVSSGISGIITADEIATGTVPKCSSCAHYMHNPSRFAHDWCYMPIPKEGGAGYIRKLNKEEAEGPACSDFKARKE